MYRTGDRIGSYVLQERIGRGAFGVVWLAEEITSLSSHKVALKLPNEEVVDVEAIKKEARVWEQVKGHPNILPIIKADIVDGQIYIASEYAPDGSLSDWLRQNNGKAPSIDSALEIIKGILAGLAHLHSKKVVHRDLKPDNILLQGEVPRIADFGIARVLKDSHTSQLAGTPGYMAPEGFKGIRSEQTDIWAVGVIFYQLITGLLPFPQSDLMSLMNAIIYEPPQFYTQLIPLPLLQIISKALEKDLKKRYQNVQVMREALKKIQNSDLEKEFNKVPLVNIFPPEVKVNDTLPTEQMQITVEDKQDTDSIKLSTAETTTFHNKHKILKWGGGILAAIVLIIGAAYTKSSFDKSESKEEINTIGGSGENVTQKPLSPKDYIDSKTKWAEWALMLENNEYEKIISETTKEIERNPANSIAHRMRATAYYNLEKKEEAREDIREILQLTSTPVIAEEYEARCYALMVLNKSDEALQNCTKAIELDSDLSLAYNVRGTIYHQKQMYDLAIADYTEAINRIERATFFRNRAITYDAMGKKKLAEDDRETADNLEQLRKPQPETKATVPEKPVPAMNPASQPMEKPKPQPTRSRPMPSKTVPKEKPKPNCIILGEC